MSHTRIRSEAGFTMIEILVVVIIIGLLSTLVATQIIKQQDRAKAGIASSQIQKLDGILELYKLDQGRYPTSEQGLEALVREPSSEPRARRYPAQPYMKSRDIEDPWGAPFRYTAPGSRNSGSYDLWSAGIDGQEGTADDIGNWDEVAQN